MRVTVSCAGNYQPAHIFPRLERTEAGPDDPTHTATVIIIQTVNI